MQVAVERYVINNAVHFNPIEFEVVDENDSHIFEISLYPEEMVLNEGTKRILSLTFAETDSDDDGIVISRIKHPLSGIFIDIFLNSPNCPQAIRFWIITVILSLSKFKKFRNSPVF